MSISMRATTNAPVKSIQTFIGILEAIEALDGAGVTDVASEMGIAKSTAHDHLKTLEMNDFVINEGGKYYVGLRFLTHGGRARTKIDLYEIAKPELNRLAEKTGEVANLIVEEHGLGVYIDMVRSDNAVNLDTYIGKREYLHNTAVGKAILANLPGDRRNEIIEDRGLPSETPQTMTDKIDFFQELETVKSQGYAIDNEERLEGLRCVGVPIKVDEERVIGAISVSGPTRRMDENRLGKLADEVMRVANIVEVNITYS